MAEWIPIENSIFMTDLLARWKDIEIDGEKFNFNTLDRLVRTGQITAYDKKDWIINAGHKEWRGQKRPPLLGLNGVQPFSNEDVILFDMEEALVVEKKMLPTIANHDGHKMVGDKFVFTEQQLIKKDALYKRWFGATHEEIATHVNSGVLSAFKYYKGPIGGLIWCTPGIVYYRGKVDWSNPDLYEYNDAGCDYFLIEDMERCEAEHPEYTGNITPESLGLVQANSCKVSDNKSEYIPAEDLRQEMELSPVRFVEFLRSNHVDLPLYGLTRNDMDFFYDNFTRLVEAADMLGNITIHCLDWENFQRYKRAQEKADTSNEDVPFPTVALDTSGLESQLAELQKQYEDLRQWNKRLNEQNQELRTELAAAKAIQPAAAPPLTPQQKAAIVRGENALNTWKPAISAMIKVAVRCGEEGRKLRQRPDFYAMFNELDVPLNGEQEKLFRESMPDEHIDRLGDARRKADPPDNV